MRRPGQLAALRTGAGTPGGYLVRQPDARRAQIREAVREILGNPRGPFTLRARALTVRGVR